MRESVSEIKDRLADQAEAVCRHYLPAGRREGNYWLVGDIHNTPGRSMYVRLNGGTSAPPGKWTEYVALLDMLRVACGPLFCWVVPIFAQHNVSTLRGDM